MNTAFDRLPKFICAVAAAACLLSGCKKTDTVEASEVTVQAEKAVVKPLTESISAESVLTPQAQAAIVPKISAPVREFHVQRGAHVARGQLLATLSTPIWMLPCMTATAR